MSFSKLARRYASRNFDRSNTEPINSIKNTYNYQNKEEEVGWHLRLVQLDQGCIIQSLLLLFRVKRLGADQVDLLFPLLLY